MDKVPCQIFIPYNKLNQQQLNVGKDKYEVKKYNTQIYQIRGFEIFSITKKKYVNPPLRRLILTLTEYEILVQNVYFNFNRFKRCNNTFRFNSN